jgi:hypothetical protein
MLNPPKNNVLGSLNILLSSPDERGSLEQAKPTTWAVHHMLDIHNPMGLRIEMAKKVVTDSSRLVVEAFYRLMERCNDEQMFREIMPAVRQSQPLAVALAPKLREVLVDERRPSMVRSFSLLPLYVEPGPETIDAFSALLNQKPTEANQIVQQNLVWNLSRSRENDVPSYVSKVLETQLIKMYEDRSLPEDTRNAIPYILVQRMKNPLSVLMPVIESKGESQWVVLSSIRALEPIIETLFGRNDVISRIDKVAKLATGDEGILMREIVSRMSKYYASVALRDTLGSDSERTLGGMKSGHVQVGPLRGRRRRNVKDPGWY